jgi:replicative DNA helicase
LTTTARTILAQLIHDDGFTRKVLPFLKDEYFENEDRVVFETIREFVEKYSTPPTVVAVRLALQQKPKLSDQTIKTALELVDEVAQGAKLPSTQEPWLIAETEKFCQDRAIYNGVVEAADILSDPIKRHSIPEILNTALSVSFDVNIGHDYIEDAEKRYDFYTQVVTKFPTGVDMIDKVLRGGIEPKTMNILAAGTNVGKTIALCSFAAHSLRQGRNVLYITCEMADMKIAERIDANLLDYPIEQLENLDRMTFLKLVAAAKKRNNLGKLVIKEYPTASAHVGHFQTLLHELKLKKGFVPDILFLDYLNICASTRFKQNQQINPYIYVKAIAEEVRGFLVKNELPGWTATQFNRQGHASSDPELDNTSESFGVPQTADFYGGMSTTEELEQAGLLVFKQLKNRYNTKSKLKKFPIKVDYQKMRIENADPSAFALVQSDDLPPASPTTTQTKHPPAGKASKNYAAINTSGAFGEDPEL